MTPAVHPTDWIDRRERTRTGREGVGHYLASRPVVPAHLLPILADTARPANEGAVR